MNYIFKKNTWFQAWMKVHGRSYFIWTSLSPLITFLQYPMHTNKVYLMIFLNVPYPDSTIYLFLDLWKTFWLNVQPAWISFRKMLHFALKLYLSINLKILLSPKMISLSSLKSTNGYSLSLELNLKSFLWFTSFYKFWHRPASLASCLPPPSLIPFGRVTLACFLLEQAKHFLLQCICTWYLLVSVRMSPVFSL